MDSLPGEDLRIKAEPENLLSVQTFLDDALRKSGFSSRQRQLCAIAAEEAFINICSYAGTDDITVSVRSCTGGLQVAFADTGRPFNPLTEETPDLTLPAHARPVGGLGIHMIRSIADAVSYDHLHGINRLELTFMRKEDLQ